MEEKTKIVPSALDLIEKGDYDVTETVTESANSNRNTNKGRRNRRRNEALKKKSLKEKEKYSPALYTSKRGLVKRVENNNTAIKKQTNQKARAMCRNISEDDPANMQSKKRVTNG